VAQNNSWLVTSGKNDQTFAQCPTVHRRGPCRLPPKKTIPDGCQPLCLSIPAQETNSRETPQRLLREVKPATENAQIEERGKILPADSMEFDKDSDRCMNAKSGTLTLPLGVRACGKSGRVSEIQARRRTLICVRCP